MCRPGCFQTCLLKVESSSEITVNLIFTPYKRHSGSKTLKICNFHSCDTETLNLCCTSTEKRLSSEVGGNLCLKGKHFLCQGFSVFHWGRFELEKIHHSRILIQMRVFNNDLNASKRGSLQLYSFIGALFV